MSSKRVTTLSFPVTCFTLYTNGTHSDKKSAVINNRYLDFVQTGCLISLVNENPVDNNLKEILVYVYSGSIANNRPKKLP